MNKVSFLFGVHMHQPVDNFDECIAEAVEKSYRPFFEVMARYPEFKFSVHCSGWLLDQIRLHYPELFTTMQKLTKKGSVEWLSAGYYEPVLSSIPSKDRQGQIKKLNNFIKKHFGTTPKGLWLTERVWESALVPDLEKSGIEYVVVDDYHFLSSAFDRNKLDGYYTTEEGGYESALFPISKALRYVLPFANVEKSIETVVSYAKRNGSAAVFFDDAEKFGLWPNTYEWVYEEKWLEKFVQAVIADKRIVPRHYTTYKNENRSLGIAYLNNTSYFEMGEWSLKNEDAREFLDLQKRLGENYFEERGVAFIKGGIWKNFFVKYSESNYLHKRMLSLSKESESFTKAQLESLYKLQTNDVFWHGVFGGVYLPNLRDNAYRYMIEIERDFKKPEQKLFDVDKDGYDELQVRTDDLSMVFSLKEGGSLMELGSFATLYNWQNTLMRRDESYHVQDSEHAQAEEVASIHDAVAMSEELQQELIYDQTPRFSFMDRFSKEEFSLERWKKGKQQVVAINGETKYNKKKESALFTTEGHLFDSEAVTLKKKYSFEKGLVSLDLKAQKGSAESINYGLEFNFHFAHMYDFTVNGEKVGDGIEQKGCKELIIYDDFTNKNLKIVIDRECHVYGFIANTISKSEAGFDKTPQQFTLIFTTSIQQSLDLKASLEICDV